MSSYCTAYWLHCCDALWECSALTIDLALSPPKLVPNVGHKIQFFKRATRWFDIQKLLLFNLKDTWIIKTIRNLWLCVVVVWCRTLLKHVSDSAAEGSTVHGHLSQLLATPHHGRCGSTGFGVPCAACYPASFLPWSVLSPTLVVRMVVKLMFWWPPSWYHSTLGIAFTMTLAYPLCQGVNRKVYRI